LAESLYPGLRVYCNDFRGPKKSNLSKITPANPNRSGPNLADMHRLRDDNVYEILGAIDLVKSK